MSQQPVEQVQPHAHVAPANLSIAVGIVNGPMKVVGLQIESPVGSNVFLMSVEMAEKVAADLGAAAKTASTGLFVPPGVNLQ